MAVSEYLALEKVKRGSRSHGGMAVSEYLALEKVKRGESRGLRRVSMPSNIWRRSSRGYI